MVSPIKKIFKKIAYFIKILFASWKKWGTIKWNRRRLLRRRSGGPHDRKKESLQLYQAGISAQPTADEDRGVGGSRIVYFGADGFAQRDYDHRREF